MCIFKHTFWIIDDRSTIFETSLLSIIFIVAFHFVLRSSSSLFIVLRLFLINFKLFEWYSSLLAIMTSRFHMTSQVINISIALQHEFFVLRVHICFNIQKSRLIDQNINIIQQSRLNCKQIKIHLTRKNVTNFKI